MRRTCNYGHPIGEGFRRPALNRKTPTAPAQFFEAFCKKRSRNPLVSGPTGTRHSETPRFQAYFMLETANGDTIGRR